MPQYAKGNASERLLMSGYRVLDLSTYVAGPFCTKLLANYGADVIKIERPESGDPSRDIGPFMEDEPGLERSLLFYYLNSDKRSLTLDISTADGRKTLRSLVAQADVIVESFTPRELGQLDLSFETFKSWNSSVVLTSVSEFGHTGPYRDYEGSHIVHCGYAAGNHGVGEYNGGPLQTGGMVTYYVAGTYALLSTLAALWRRDATGQGQHVETSVMEAAADAGGYTTFDYGYRGILRARTPGNVFPGAVPCSDGWVGLNALSYRNWVRLCQLMEREDLLDDPRFDDNTGRREFGMELLDAAILWSIDQSKWDILRRGQETGAAIGVIFTAQDILDLPQHNERNFFHHSEHQEMGHVVAPGYPFRVNGGENLESPSWSPAPTLGQHNEEILSEMLNQEKD